MATLNLVQDRALLEFLTDKLFIFTDIDFIPLNILFVVNAFLFIISNLFLSVNERLKEKRNLNVYLKGYLGFSSRLLHNIIIFSLITCLPFFFISVWKSGCSIFFTWLFELKGESHFVGHFFKKLAFTIFAISVAAHRYGTRSTNNTTTPQLYLAYMLILYLISSAICFYNLGKQSIGWVASVYISVSLAGYFLLSCILFLVSFAISKLESLL